MEVLDVEEVSFFIEQGKTYQQISDILKERYPGIRGLSLRSLKRFCASNGLSTRASQESIELNVSSAVEEVRKLIYFNLKFFFTDAVHIFREINFSYFEREREKLHKIHECTNVPGLGLYVYRILFNH